MVTNVNFVTLLGNNNPVYKNLTVLLQSSSSKCFNVGHVDENFRLATNYSEAWEVYLPDPLVTKVRNSSGP